MVSFNTMDLTAQMIYSLFRHVRIPRFRLVVVDDASTDGSAPMLQALADANLCEVIFDNDQRYRRATPPACFPEDAESVGRRRARARPRSPAARAGPAPLSAVTWY